jgi:hypothetical protein
LPFTIIFRREIDTVFWYFPVAPAYTAAVSFFVRQSANTMYFDSIEAVEVEEVPEIVNVAFFPQAASRIYMLHRWLMGGRR